MGVGSSVGGGSLRGGPAINYQTLKPLPSGGTRGDQSLGPHGFKAWYHRFFVLPTGPPVPEGGTPTRRMLGAAASSVPRAAGPGRSGGGNWSDFYIYIYALIILLLCM